MPFYYLFMSKKGVREFGQRMRLKRVTRRLGPRARKFQSRAIKRVGGKGVYARLGPASRRHAMRGRRVR